MTPGFLLPLGMFFLGMDLGQQRDHTAIVVVERLGQSKLLVVRWVERIALGTPYVRVVERLKEIVRSGEFFGRVRVAVDGGSMGSPVMEMIGLAGLGCDVAAVVSTAGSKAKSGGLRGIGSWYTVPKKDLLGEVLVRLEKRELRFAKDLPELGNLLKELKDMQMTVSAKDSVRMGADGSGQHDDLVIALALACWRASGGEFGEKNYPIF